LPDEVAKLKNQYAEWFADVTKKGFAPPRIVLGSGQENPVRLSRQDWRGAKAGRAGYWTVRVERAGEYEVTLLSKGKFNNYSLSCSYDSESGASLAVRAGGRSTRTMRRVNVTVELKKGDARLEAEVEANGKRRGVDYVEVKYIGAGK
jgi:arylsulfatase/arylsulfatase A